MGRKLMEKRISYRLPPDGRSEDERTASLAEHWRGFTWTTGRWVVSWVSDRWGEVQVWAITEEEGQGVIRHALDHMGAPEEDGEWLASLCRSPRFGKVMDVTVGRVSARDGPRGTVPFALV